MEATYETCIILIPVGKITADRQSLEDIQNEKFDSIQAVKVALCDIEDNGREVYKHVSIYSMDYFMDAWNNTDDGTPKKERLTIKDHWFGYVQIKTTKQI